MCVSESVYMIVSVCVYLALGEIVARRETYFVARELRALMCIIRLREEYLTLRRNQ